MRRGRGKFDYGFRDRVDYEAMRRERLPDTTARTITASLFLNAAVFFAAALAGPPQSITATSYAGEADTFGTAAISRVAIPVTPSLFTNAQTFGSAALVPGPRAITGTLFSDLPDTFGLGSIGLGTSPTQGLAPALYTDADTFNAASLGIGIPATLFANAQTFNAAAVVLPMNELLVMAGQSGAIAKLTNGVPAPGNILAIDTNRVKIWNAGAWQGYVAGTNTSQTYDGTFASAWGQEGEYARNWLAQYPAGTLYIVKHTADGTHIMSTSGPDWNASPLGELLSGLNTKVVAGLAAIGGVTLNRRRAIWDLGSSDALDAQTYAEAFYVNMLGIYTYQRTNWSIGKITHVRVRTQNLPYAPIVRAAQNRIAYDDANATLINVDDLTLSDSYHFSPAGTVTVGLRAWDALENGTSVEIPYADLTGTLYTDADSFNAASVSVGSIPTQNVTLSLYTDADSFNAAAVTSGVTILATLYSDADSFNSATVVPGAVAITGTLYDDGTDIFNSATVALTAAEDADTTAFFAAVATAGLTAPPTGWRPAYDNLIKAAKGGSNPWWGDCDIVRVLAGYDRAVSRRNLKQDAFHATETGTVSWTAKAGFNSLGTGKLVSTYNPTTASGCQYLQNDAHYMFWSDTNNQSANADFAIWTGTAGSFFIARNTSNNTQGRVNQSANSSTTGGTTTDGSGHWAISRTGSTTLNYYRNGTLFFNSATASVAVISATEELGGLAATYTSRVYKAESIGGGLTAAQAAQQKSDFDAFFTAIAGL